MLKKTITYEDFNGDSVTEDHFFHLSKAELVELEMSHDGGMSAALQRIVDAEDGKSIIAEFKNIILGSYGKRSPDGKRFTKNQQLREEFESSEAYSTLFMELVTDTDAAIEFINGVVPQGMAEEAAKIAQLTTVEEGVKVIPGFENLGDDGIPKDEPLVGTVSKADLASMDSDEFKKISEEIASGKVKVVE